MLKFPEQPEEMQNGTQQDSLSLSLFRVRTQRGWRELDRAGAPVSLKFTTKGELSFA